MSGPWDQFKPSEPSGAKPWEKFSPSSASPIAKEQESKPFGQQLSEGLRDIPRQLGLTARYGIEGVGDTLDMVSSPIRAGLNALLPKSSAIQGRSGAVLANSLNLPQPQNAAERMVGDASRMIAGGALPIAGAANLAKNTTGTAQAVSKLMAANPMQQLGSAGAAGLAGGYTRETGGDEFAQTVASLAAGVAAPFAINGALRGAKSIASTANKMANPASQNLQLEKRINSALENSGVNFGEISSDVANSIRSDIGKAIDTGGTLSPDAVRRLVDYRSTGLTPTAATLSLDPALISQQKNLAKLGINSKDPSAQRLGMIENANNRNMISGLNDMGANTVDDAYAGGGKIIDALQSHVNDAKASVGKLYESARASDGRSAMLDPHAFTNGANNLLDDALLGGKLPADVRNLLNKAAKGEMPLTVDVAEQFKTRIGDLQRASSDGAERKALGMVRQALDDTPLIDGQGQIAMDAFGKARAANREWMQVVEKTPALQAVMNGVEPDKFVKQFVIGGGTNANTMDLAMLKNAVKKSPEAMSAVKEQIASYLKSSASNGAADEVANFSQSGFNKALNSIGDRKLGLFFSQDEVSQLKALGRVASYEQAQPRGAAVNNSNTAAAGLSTIFDRIGSNPLISKIPFGKQMIGDPLQNISIGMQANKALNIPNALTMPMQNIQRQPQGLLLSPAAFMLPEDERRGLLSP